MGGNLLKKWNLPEKRLNPEEYKNLSAKVLHTLTEKYVLPPSVAEFCPHLGCGVAPSLRLKESHGDLDVIASIEYIRHDADQKEFSKSFRDFLEKEYGYKPIQNSNVFSFPVENFQVDVTIVPEGEFYSSINYTSWGDLSNLMGRIFHKMGLHYGHSGLSFWIRQGLFDKNIDWSDNDHIYEKFRFSTYMPYICDIGGFDYSRWAEGFDTEKDAFDFVIQSKYFDKSLFLVENLNHINRVRNRKRPMYMRFIEYIEGISISKKEEFLSKENYSLIFQNKIPELRKRIDFYRFENSINNFIKQKINGHIIKEMYPEMEGKQIGLIMQKIKSQYTTDELLAMPSSSIPEIINNTKTILESSC